MFRKRRRRWAAKPVLVAFSVIGDIPRDGTREFAALWWSDISTIAWTAHAGAGAYGNAVGLGRERRLTRVVFTVVQVEVGGRSPCGGRPRRLIIIH